MKQYLELLQTIREKGTYKTPARENMPGTTSLFGYQFRCNLQDGFPLLTTKKMFFKGVVVELLWFLRGDTNIKFLVDNGVNIWNEDAYNYYCKLYKEEELNSLDRIPYDTFISKIKEGFLDYENRLGTYTLGDCGFQYGKVWRNGFFSHYEEYPSGVVDEATGVKEMIGESVYVDQIANLIKGLKENPTSRRHIVTAIDPANEDNLALYWCHAMFQFNCRSLTIEEKSKYISNNNIRSIKGENGLLKPTSPIPQYHLDCQLYQRSADVFLGVPFNIASYALLTEIIAKMCNMIPGEFIHTFGDVHIYDNHKEAVEEQLKREPTELPRLNLRNGFVVEYDHIWNKDLDFALESMINYGWENIIKLENYNPQPSIKAELSTGLKK